MATWISRALRHSYRPAAERLEDRTLLIKDHESSGHWSELVLTVLPLEFFTRVNLPTTPRDVQGESRPTSVDTLFEDSWISFLLKEYLP